MAEFLTYLPGILLAYAAFMVGLISPGPALMALMGVSLGDGRRAGRYFALGIGSGSFCIGILTLSGLSALLLAYADAMYAIRIAGGCYLLWMAFKALKAAARPAPVSAKADTDPQQSAAHYFSRGLALHLTNPKAILTWIAIISIGFHPGAPLWVGLVIVASCGLISTLVHLFYATAFSTRPVIALYRRLARWINAILGVFFAALGLKLIFSR
ncbi:lysine transporter LysE [Thalassospira profundimaris]|uniref:Lysine transporter LysE n=1 Tax=Thalassospira profundimaris TaxID=502049 RepID=A0A367WPR8_9PROT|nr:LysE family transporter [Thalassospira profundimaris]RCK43466.1 lysine transporter LysE [Thalassospira profundimaris]